MMMRKITTMNTMMILTDDLGHSILSVLPVKNQFFHTSMYLYDFFYHLHTKSSVATKRSIVSKNAFHVDITYAQIFDF